MKIRINTPYLKDEVEAQCLHDAIYDLIIGHVKGARDPGNPDPEWEKVGTKINYEISSEESPTTQKAFENFQVSKLNCGQLRQAHTTSTRGRFIKEI